MFNLLAVSADAFALHVAEDFKSTFGSAHHPVAKRLESVSRLAVECIARCDALYHNLEHTLLVTVVGIEILRGMKLSRQLDPEEYAHMLIACLLHDIGYVRGVLRGDGENNFVVDAGGRRIRLEGGATDASLAPYHVERSKLFACERLAHSPEIDLVPGVVPPPERPPDSKKRSPAHAANVNGAGLEESGQATTFSYELSQNPARTSSWTLDQIAGLAPRLGITDAPCPFCASKVSARGARRPVFRIWRERDDFVTFACARCGEKGWAKSAPANTAPPRDRLVQMRREAVERQTAERANSLRKACWLWSASRLRLARRRSRICARRVATTDQSRPRCATCGPASPGIITP